MQPALNMLVWAGIVAAAAVAIAFAAAVVFGS
jgi:hypothetical protein